MAQSSKGSSVIGFIAIGIIMVGLLAGGIYLIRQQQSEPDVTSSQEIVDEPDAQEPVVSEETDNTDSEEQPPATTSPSDEEVNIEALPQSGPAEALTSLIVLALLCGVGVSYLRSRRPELSL